MKKSMLILTLFAMLTACGTPENEAVIKVKKVPFIMVSETETHIETTVQIPTETTTTAVSTTRKSETVTATSGSAMTVTATETAEAEIQLEYAETTVKTDVQESTEIPQYIVTEPDMQTTTETITETTVTETEETEPVTKPVNDNRSDYEKALEVYNYMTANGGGTCVQYSWQTYEMCQDYGLQCYFAWTENQLYGHVANVVMIDGMWYVLDTQAGCFLTENMCGFTEIVDANESYIASAGIISSVRYE